MCRFSSVLMVLVGILASRVSFAAEEKDKAKYLFDVEVPLMGDYVGKYAPTVGAAVNARATVAYRGGETYLVALLPELEAEKGEPVRWESYGTGDGNRLAIDGSSKGSDLQWTGSAGGGKLVAEAQGEAGGRFELKRVFRRSRTEGIKPPQGAVVLLPMTDGPPPLDAWMTPKAWKPLPGGIIQSDPGSGYLKSKQEFRNYKLHLEFMVAYQPIKEVRKTWNRGGGNSGVKFHGLYEVQILDSFGLLPPSGGDCGAVYRVATPKVNASFPPLRWQTFDITFHAAEFDENGNIRELPVITVVHNGVTVCDRVKVPGPTSKSTKNDRKRQGLPMHIPTGPLAIQRHADSLRFRNIWLVELPEQPEEQGPASR